MKNRKIKTYICIIVTILIILFIGERIYTMRYQHARAEAQNECMAQLGASTFNEAVMACMTKKGYTFVR